MEWTEIDDDGTKMEAMDYLDGVLLRDPLRTGLAFCQGWQVINRGDMDGPQLRERWGKPVGASSECWLRCRFQSRQC